MGCALWLCCVANEAFDILQHPEKTSISPVLRLVCKAVETAVTREVLQEHKEATEATFSFEFRSRTYYHPRFVLPTEQLKEVSRAAAPAPQSFSSYRNSRVEESPDFKVVFYVNTNFVENNAKKSQKVSEPLASEIPLCKSFSLEEESEVLSLRYDEDGQSPLRENRTMSKGTGSHQTHDQNIELDDMKDKSLQRHFVPNLREKVLVRGIRDSRDAAGEGEEGEEEEEESSTTIPTAVSRSRGGGRYASADHGNDNDEIDGTDAGSDRESEEEQAPDYSIRPNTKFAPLANTSPVSSFLHVGMEPPASVSERGGTGNLQSVRGDDLLRKAYFLLSTEPPLTADSSPDRFESILHELDIFLSDMGGSVEAVIEHIGTLRLLALQKISGMKFLSCVLREGDARVCFLPSIPDRH